MNGVSAADGSCLSYHISHSVETVLFEALALLAFLVPSSAHLATMCVIQVLKLGTVQ